jgi:hypothetical protein
VLGHGSEPSTPPTSGGSSSPAPRCDTARRAWSACRRRGSRPGSTQRHRRDGRAGPCRSCLPSSPPPGSGRTSGTGSRHGRGQPCERDAMRVWCRARPCASFSPPPRASGSATCRDPPRTPRSGVRDRVLRPAGQPPQRLHHVHLPAAVQLIHPAGDMVDPEGIVSSQRQLELVASAQASGLCWDWNAAFRVWIPGTGGASIEYVRKPCSAANPPTSTAGEWIASGATSHGE